MRSSDWHAQRFGRRPPGAATCTACIQLARQASLPSTWYVGRPSASNIYANRTSSPRGDLGRARCSRTTRDKVPVGYNGTRQIHPQNCPFLFDDHHPHLIHIPRPTPLTAPKRHPDPISHFATIHFPDRQTDTLDKRQVYSNSGYALLH